MPTYGTSGDQKIAFTYLSQEDLPEAGCRDFGRAIDAAEEALLARRRGDVLLPDKIGGFSRADPRRKRRNR